MKLLYRSFYFTILCFLVGSITWGDDSSSINLSGREELNRKGGKVVGSSSKQELYTALKSSLVKYGIPVGAIGLIVIGILIYRRGKDDEKGLPPDSAQPNIDVSVDVIGKPSKKNRDVNVDLIAKSSKKNRDVSVDLIAKSSKKNIDVSVDVIGKPSKKNRDVNVDLIGKPSKKNIDKSSVALKGPKKAWDVTNYSIYRSTIIEKSSPIVTSKCVRRSYYSYRSSEDVGKLVSQSKPLFVNAANSRLFFDGDGTNLYLSRRIREKQRDVNSFLKLKGKEKWGVIKDFDGKKWDRKSLKVGETMISYDRDSNLSIAHILAPSGTKKGHDQLKEGIKNLCVYAYNSKKYDSLILPVPGSGIFAGSDAEIGNGAYQAIIQGVELFIKEIYEKSKKLPFIIYFNWWDSRVVVNIPENK